MRPSVVLLFTTSLLAAGLSSAFADVNPVAKGKAVVAVLPFTSPTTYSAMGRNAQETFLTQLVKAGQVRVIESKLVDRMLRKHGLAWTGTLDPNLLKAAGGWLQADYMLAGKLRWGGDAYILSAHVMNVRTLETTMAEDIDFRDETKMRIAVRALARKMAGIISGSGSASSGSELFLNVDPRAFYDSAEFCIHALSAIVDRYEFNGSVEASDEASKTIQVKGVPTHLPEGIPLEVFSTTSVDEPAKLAVAYIVRKIAGGYEARYRTASADGIELGAKVANGEHRWTVAVGKVEDEVEDNDKLVDRFRQALLEKMSEGTKFQEVEGNRTDWLAKLSNRQSRPAAYRQLLEQGIDIVLEGKFYGSSGSRRAHFKIYSTQSGKLLGEPKFETRL